MIAARVWLPTVIALVHLALCLWQFMEVRIPHEQSVWNWLLIALIDVPVSIPIMVTTAWIPPLLAYGIAGTLWWFWLVWFVYDVLPQGRA